MKTTKEYFNKNEMKCYSLEIRKSNDICNVSIYNEMKC